MSIVTAHSTVVNLLSGPSPEPSPMWQEVYVTHGVADMAIPSLSVGIISDEPDVSNSAINQSEYVDNRVTRMSILIHTAYRLMPVDYLTARVLTDEVITLLRTHVKLGNGYRLMSVDAVNFHHTSLEGNISGTTGAEILITVHKVETYTQV